MLNSINSQEWIKNQWPSKMFFDPRLHKRVIKIAQAFLNFPNRSIPKRFTSAGDVKACYNILKRPEMDHQTLQIPHYENVLEEALKSSGKVLLIQDGSELLYNSHKWTSGLGPTGDAYGHGIMFHSCLAVKIEEEHSHVIGLACQKAWVREEAQEKKDTEESEGEVWRKMIEWIGAVPLGHVWITVGDRASDIFLCRDVV